MPLTALGIPDRSRFPVVPSISEPAEWQFALQKHLAYRAGPHFDLRLAPDNKAHSWAVRRWPKPGEKVLAVQQPAHTRRYMDWSGEIPRGQYGGGTVSLEQRGVVKVISSSPERIKFVRFRGKEADEFDMIRTDGRNWLLVNSSTTPERYQIPQHKPTYGVTEFDDRLADQPGVMSPKIDGAHGILVLKPGKHPRLFSVRKPVSGGLIEWTHKIPDLWKQRVPSDVDATLRVEVFMADRNGAAMPAEHTASVLNSGIEQAIEQQKGTGGLRIMPFAVADDESPYEQQLDRIFQMAKRLPFMSSPEVARTSGEKRRMIEQIRSGSHPMTREGVVVWDKSPMKAKIHQDADVYPVEVFGGEGKYSDSAGGFVYSTEPDGEPVGRVGSGLSDDFRNELWQNRDRVRGRVATVRYDKRMPSGALYAPRFIRWHPDKDPGDYAEAEMTRADRFKMGFLRKMAELGLRPSDLESYDLCEMMSKRAGIRSALGLALPTGRVGLTALIAAPMSVGALTGAFTRQVAKADDPDVKEVKMQEARDAYRKLTADVIARIKARQSDAAKRIH